MRILVSSIFILGLAACASKSPAPSATATTPPPPQATDIPATPAFTAPLIPPHVAAAKAANSDSAPTSIAAVPSTTATSAVQEPTAPRKVAPRGPVPSEKALGWLKNGNTRFTKHKLRNDGDRATDRKRLVTGEKPHSVVLSCSDSRVPPEVVFDQKLGEIFVVRNVGATLDAASLASIEYAVEQLGSNLIVVLGHESCSAIKSALASLDDVDAGSPWLNRLAFGIQPHLGSFKRKPASEGVVVEGWAHISGVAKDLVERSQIVRDAVNSGDVKIQTALYHLGTGAVEFK